MELINSRIYLLKSTISIFCLFLLACSGNTNRSITSIGVCVNPIEPYGCIEVNSKEVFYSVENVIIDSLQNFERVKVAKITTEEFQRITKIVLSSDLVKGKIGKYMIGEEQFCIDINYSTGSQQSFKKNSLTSKDYKSFKKLLSFTSPTSIDSFGHKISTINCAIYSVPSEIQQPMEISVPTDTIE